MKKALIPPLARLADLDSTTMQLMLPHLTKHQEYSDRYKELGKRPQQFIILDNGAAEGLTWSLADLHAMSYDYEADEIVLPDVLKDMQQTLQLVTESLDWLRANYTYPDRSPFQYMVVVQGTNADELRHFIREVAWLDSSHWIKTWGIPRHLLKTCRNKAIRLEVAEWLMGDMTRQVHLLGTTPEWIREGQFASRQVNIRSIDTSAPYVYGLAGQDLDSAFQHPRPTDYFEAEPTPAQHQMIQHNVLDYLGW